MKKFMKIKVQKRTNIYFIIEKRVEIMEITHSEVWKTVTFLKLALYHTVHK